jgi:hypothetical protein
MRLHDALTHPEPLAGELALRVATCASDSGAAAAVERLWLIVNI